MKIKPGFVLKEIAGSWVVVPVGEQLVDFQMMMTLNESGAFLWKLLQQETTKEELLSALLKEYDVDAETARTDLDEFLKRLCDKGILQV